MRRATAIRVGKVATAPSRRAPTSATTTAAVSRARACAGRAGMVMHARRALARTSAAGRAPASTSNAIVDTASPDSIVPHSLARAIAAAKGRATMVPPPFTPSPTHPSTQATFQDLRPACTGTCYCSPGWRGIDCSLRTCPNDCSYDGYCINGTCNCYPGFVGNDCSGKVCPGSELVPQKICSGRGSCGRNVTCMCDLGWTGFDCSLEACDNDCSYNGYCFNGA